MAISNPVSVGAINTLASSGSQALVTTGAVPSGAKLWILVSWFSAFTLSSVTDGTNAYAIDHQSANGSSGVAIVSADIPAGLASGSTITANYSGSSADRAVCAMYSTGVATTGVGVAYGAAGASQNAATGWTGVATTVTTGDILIAASHWEDSVAATSTATTGTEVHDISTGSGSSITSTYRIGTGASITATGTWSATSAASSGTRSASVAYKAAVVAAAGSTPRVIVSREAQRRASRW